MKKLILFSLITCLMFMVAACNDPTGDGGGGGNGDETDIVFTWGADGEKGTGYAGTPEYGTGRLGFSLLLRDAYNINDLEGNNLKPLGEIDISLYGEMILDATLYSLWTDNDTYTVAEYKADLAQFAIIVNESNWDNQLGHGYNMVADGKTNGSVNTGATGNPIYLLVQNNTEIGELAKIEVRQLTLKLRTDLPSFVKVYDNGSFITLNGNSITFNNAQYGNAAVLYEFDPADLPLTDKTVTIAFRIEGGDDDLEHQLNVQAAGDGTNSKNGSDAGQKYITLEDTMNVTTKAGAFTLSGTELENASQATGGSDNDAPFTLGGIRIENNGTTYQEHYRDKSYTLIITSITVK